MWLHPKLHPQSHSWTETRNGVYILSHHFLQCFAPAIYIIELHEFRQNFAVPGIYLMICLVYFIILGRISAGDAQVSVRSGVQDFAVPGGLLVVKSTLNELEDMKLTLRSQ